MFSVTSFLCFSSSLSWWLNKRSLSIKHRPAAPQVITPVNLVTPKDEKYVAIAQNLLDTVPRPIHSHFLVAAVVSYVDLQGMERHVIGVNSETCVLPSAICAERTAFLTLRLQPHGVKYVNTVYITATAPNPISPGMLCREFMQEYSGTTMDDDDDDVQTRGGRRRGIRVFLFAPGWLSSLSSAAEAAEAKAEADDLLPLAPTVNEHGDIPDNVNCCVCMLDQLFPCPPIYHKVPRDALVDYGTKFAAEMVKFDLDAATLCLDAVANKEKKKSGEAVEAEEGQNRESLPSPLQVVALYEQVKSLAQKPSPADQLYPINRAAGILFADGTSVLAREDKCLEYGCTRDAVVALSHSVMSKKYVSTNTSIHPILLIQTDQFGICTAPAAAPRAWYHEYGFDGLVVPVHTTTTTTTTTSSSSSSSISRGGGGGRLLISSIFALSPSSPAISLSKVE